MHVSEWIALVTPVLAIIGTGYAGVVKLERMASAIERMGDNLATVVNRVDDHESRIRELEH